MTNKEYVKKILLMNECELLDEIIANPEYLTDSYYKEFGDAIMKRYAQLRGKS